MKPKWKPHDDPRCACSGCQPSVRWLSLGVPQPDSEYDCAGIPTDAMDIVYTAGWFGVNAAAIDEDAIRRILETDGFAVTFSDEPPRYQQTVSGWSNKRVCVTDGDPGDEDRS